MSSAAVGESSETCWSLAPIPWTTSAISWISSGFEKAGGTWVGSVAFPWLDEADCGPGPVAGVAAGVQAETINTVMRRARMGVSFIGLVINHEFVEWDKWHVLVE